MSNIEFAVTPNPIIDSKEEKAFKELTERYEKLREPGLILKAGKKIGEFIPEPVLEKLGDAKDSLSEKELYLAALKTVADGFKQIQKLAARYTLGEADIVKKLDKAIPEHSIGSIEEACFARSYDLAKLANKARIQNIGLALFEGGVTGYVGFPGIPFNLALSTFLYFRAVQSIAMFYGYDVKHNAEELEIAAQVFSEAMAPESDDGVGMGSTIGKIMLVAELQGVKQTATKTWSDMAARGGIGLLLLQMRSLANKAAAKALENAGAKGLEETVFKNVFEQIGRRLSLASVKGCLPYVSGVIVALFDTSQMNKVLEFADIFYQKRFIAEKEVRINEFILGVSDEPHYDVVQDEVTEWDRLVTS